jgi:thiamine transport system substrate-binding protein
MYSYQATLDMEVVMNNKLIVFILMIALLMAGCTQADQSPTPPGTTGQATEETNTPSLPEPETLTVMTHDSFAASEEVIVAFEKKNNIRIQFLESGDTGTALNKAILAKDNPIADVFYGVDNTFLSRALEEGIFESYKSPILSEIPDDFELDHEHHALPVDFGDVCPNYDIDFFEDNNLTPPNSLEDLTAPDYKDMLVVENPATSSPGLAFLLATIGYFGEEGYLDYWNELIENDVLVVNDWETAYYSEFTRSGGTRPIVISYGSSPPFEVIFAAAALDAPPTAAIVSDGSCFRQIEFVGILKGTQNRDLAEKWIDFMLSPEFQEDIPLQMFVFPVNENAELDEIFIQYLGIPENPAYVSPDAIAANREIWIQDWTEIVLR